MDNKKLMYILLRDVQELEELVGEMHQDGICDRLDLELLRTRISGVRHLLQAASGMKEVAGETPVRPLPSVETPPPPPERIPRPDYAMPSAAPTPAAQATTAAPQTTPVSQATPAAPVTPAVQAAPQALPTPVPPTPPAAGELLFEEPKFPAEGKPLIEDLFFQSPGPEEEKEVHHEKHTLGEKFTAGKSVHDLLMTDKTKSDLKFSNIPISNLHSAIGTNDRFLFTRELFEGNMDQFNETVRQLDAMNTIREAVDFLQDHFKWKRSETSNKFLDLVRRRFL